MSNNQKSQISKPVKYAIFWLVVIVVIFIVHEFIFRTGPALRFNEDAFLNIGVVLAPLLLIALFVERAVEVIITPMHAKKSEDIRTKIKFAKPGQSGRSKSANDFMGLNLDLNENRNTTRNHAFIIAVILGLIAALTGVRGLEGLLAEGQEISGIFRIFDIFLTGLIIGGGAEGIHKIVKMFTDFAEKASGRDV